MNLLLNALLTNGKIILFDNSRKIISEKDIETLGNESEKLIGFIDDFLIENNLEYRDLENIVVAAGPGSFTGIRTISLLVNTINFVIKKNITPLSFFDLYNNYPIIKSSSKRDSFFQKNKTAEIEVIMNDEILKYLKENNIIKLYGENKNLAPTLTPPLTPPLQEGDNKKSPLLGGDTGKAEGGFLQIFEKINYFNIIKNIEFKNEKKINPIYIKKPNIS